MAGRGVNLANPLLPYDPKSKTSTRVLEIHVAIPIEATDGQDYLDRALEEFRYVGSAEVIRDVVSPYGLDKCHEIMTRWAKAADE